LKLKHEQLVFSTAEPFVLFVETKSGKNREVGLTTAAIEAVQSYPRISNCPYVFPNPKTMQPWVDLKKPWDSAREKAGYSWLRVHDLRTAYGIKLAERGVPMHFIQYILRHSSVKVTEERYARFRPDAPRRYVLRVLEGGKQPEEVAV
jgi:integrase